MKPLPQAAALALLLLATLEVGLRVLGAGALIWQGIGNEIRPEDEHLLRIVALGESTTADEFPPGPHSAWPRQLERKLTESGVRARVYNLGRTATTTSMILARLPEQLDRFRPHMVISMMGVNDSDTRLVPGSPGFSDHFRVVKMARWIRSAIATIWVSREERSHAITAGIEQATQLAESNRGDECLPIAKEFLRQGWTGDDDSITAFSKCAAISQRKEEWAKTLPGLSGNRMSVEYLGPNEATRRNYQELHRLLASRKIIHIAMQYPTRDVATLKGLLLVGPDNGDLRFVENRTNFAAALLKHPYEKLFTDHFGKTWGHTTDLGSSLIAEAASAEIRRLIHTPK